MVLFVTAFAFIQTLVVLYLLWVIHRKKSVPAQPHVAFVYEPEKQLITYEKSGLSDGLLAEGWQALEQLMIREKPYLNPDLSLDELAERLKLSRHHLSQILNQKAERNFYAYINEYRVIEMQRLMKQTPNKRILELAFGVGFQSKTTLNTYFKKVTSYSPTEYQRLIMNQRTEPLQL